MAKDEQKFDLELRTTADTSGLEKTERELRKVEDAGKDAAQASSNPMGMPEEMLGPRREENELIQEKIDLTELSAESAEDAAVREAQAQEDVERAIGLRSERERQAENEEVRQHFGRLGRLAMYGTAIKATMGFAGEEINGLLDKIDEIDPAFAEQFSGVRKYAEVMEAPFQTVFEDLKESAGDVLNALAGDPKSAVRGLEQAAQRWEQTRLRISQVIQNEITTEQRMLDRQLQTIREIEAISRAEGALEQAQRDNRDETALRGGADAEVVAVGRAQEELQTTLAGLREGVDMAQMEVNAQEQLLVSLGRQLKTARDQGNQPELVEEITAQIESAEQGLRGAKDQLGILSENLPTEELAASTENAGKIVELATRQTQQTTEAVETLQNSLEQTLPAATEQGKQFIEGAMKSLSDALADGVVEASENLVVADAITRLKRANDAQQGEIKRSIDELIRQVEAQQQTSAAQNARIDALSNQ